MWGKRRRKEGEIAEELAGHLERRQADLMAAGLDAEAARRQARLEFGSTDNYREEARAALGWARWDALRQDLRDALRQMRRAPGLAATVVLTLALAMGANTALFSMLDAVLLRPLNYPHPERILIENNSLSYPIFKQFQARLTSLESIAAQSGYSFTLLGQGAPARIWATQTTPGYFKVFDTAPILGQVFTRAELDRGDRNVAVLDYQFWRQKLNGRRNVIGKSLNLDGKLFRILGVMPPGFNLSRSVQFRAAVWVPLQLKPAQRTNNFASLFILGRLKPGFTRRQFQSQLSAIWKSKGFPAKNYLPPNLQWRTYRSSLVGNYHQPLWLLISASGLLLLLACLNIAGLLLARNAGRRAEIAMRAVLGASRRRILRQLLAESALSGIAGGGLGLLLGAWMLAGLRAAAVAAGLPRMQHVTISGISLAFSGGLLILTVLIFGLLPAWEASRVNLNHAANQARRGTPSRSSRRILETLVVGELAFAVALAFGASLLLRSYAQLTSLPLGFNPHHLLMFSTDMPPGPAQESNHDRQRRAELFIQQALHRLRVLPGIQSAGFIGMPPFYGLMMLEVQRRNSPHYFDTLENVTSPGLLRTLGVPLLQGRDFTAADNSHAPKVALVSQALAEELWPHQYPIGRVFLIGGKKKTAYRVIGETGNAMQYGPFGSRAEGINMLAQPTIYLPYTQANIPMYTFIARTTMPPLSLAPEIRRIFNQINPTEPVNDMQSFQQLFASLLASRRLYLDLLSAMAGLALLLVMAGVFGVSRFMAAARTGEIGIRKALGAENAAVLRLLLRRTAILALSGATLGAGLGLLLARLLTRLLYGVTPTDAATLIAVAALAMATALIAAWLPARRAARRDPLAVLRYE